MNWHNNPVEAPGSKISNAKGGSHMCTREDALKVIVFDKKGYGKIEILQHKIGKDLFSEFRNLGYVLEIRPTSSDNKPILWQRTNIADEDYKFYDPDFKSSLREFYATKYYFQHSIKHIDKSKPYKVVSCDKTRTEVLKIEPHYSGKSIVAKIFRRLTKMQLQAKPQPKTN